jgi:type IV secretion system protein VirB5
MKTIRFNNKRIENMAQKIDTVALSLFSPLPIKLNDSLSKPLKITKGEVILFAGLVLGSLIAPAPAHAMAVFDAANFGQTIQQVQQGVQELAGQANQLVELKNQVTNQLQQIQQLKQQFENLSGVTGIGDLGNIGTQARNLLPKDLDSIKSFGNSDSIASAKKLIDLADTSIKPDSAAGKLFTEQRRQNAVNAAATQAAYQASFDRMTDIQKMLDQIEQSPSAKQIADLQARIQVEQVFLQNESLRLAAMAQMRESQKDITAQQASEARLLDSKRVTSTRY